jgi:putative membrane-bound dehydrogenase-like protein
MRRTALTCSLLLTAASAWRAADGPPQPQPGPKSPAASLRALHARPGFTVELVAAEPLTKDPVAFDWGPDGKLWVVEMADYPLGMDNKGKPGGRVRFLEDTNGDGRYVKSTLFLDGLEYPSGIMAWGKGVLVTCAPEIFYAEDTDGDGKADKRVVLFTGFGEVNPQHRVNGLRWGLDNWIYCANGDFAQVRDRGTGVASGPAPRGTPFSAAEDVRRLELSGAGIKSIKTGAVVDIRNRDFRFRPGDGVLDPQSGQAQYGRDRDDWDNWFGCNNAVPMWHYVLADQYLRRNPHVAAPGPRVDAPASLTYPSGTAGRDSGTQRSSQGNAFTSACGIALYRDELFGPEFIGNWFVCEPVHNLVHRQVLSPDGVTFTSRRAPDEVRREFLSSEDTWFTPTIVRTGPDGAVWVSDMYRKALEHPNWMPKGWEKKVDVRAGEDQGRIYRVYPTGKRPRPIPRLDRLDTAGLVAALDSPNGWQRDTAQQLLLRRADPAAVPLLEKQAAERARALCRLHSLCTLDGLKALKPEVLQHALADAHPGVRRQAVRLCEGRLAGAAGLGDALVKTAADADAQVRLQLAYTLGEWDDPRSGRTLGELMLKEAGDRYLSAAAMSSVNRKNLNAIVATIAAGSHGSPPPPLLVENLLRSAAGFAHTGATVVLLDLLATPDHGKYAPWQYTALAGLLDALDQRNSSLSKLGEKGGPELRAALKRLAGLFDAARAAVANPRTSRDEQLPALRLLGRGTDQREKDLATLGDLLVPQTASDLQAVAVAALGQFRDPAIAEVLLRGWKGYGPGLRTEVIDVLCRRDEWVTALLDGLEGKRLLPGEFSAPQQKRLLEHKAAAIRDRATRLLGGAVNPDRQKVVEAYKSALALKGQPSRGLPLFTKHCATCHRLGNVGQQVGPDLAMVRDKPPEWFLPALLDPNQAVEARYLNYMAVTKNGLTLTGVLSNESGNSITLIGPEGKPQTILRSDLEELASTGKSAMPEGLEKDLKPQDVADLITLLRGRTPAAASK